MATLGLASILAMGCEKRLDAAAFLERYERECAVTVPAEGCRFILLYESPEFLAASNADPKDSGVVPETLVRTYGEACYVRLSIRPDPRPGDEMPGVSEARSYAIDRMLRTLPGGFAAKIRLTGPGGKSAKPVAVSLMSGSQSGAANTTLIAFAKKDLGEDFNPSRWQLIVDEFGLNLGTLRSRLKPAKGYRLKVAT
jgi:hypothetical protein